MGSHGALLAAFVFWPNVIRMVVWLRVPRCNAFSSKAPSAIDAAGARLAMRPHARLRRDPAEGNALVVLPERAVRLNESGREILSLCDGGRSAIEIAAELRRRHPDAEDVESDVHTFVDRMRKLGVLEAVGR